MAKALLGVAVGLSFYSFAYGATPTSNQIFKRLDQDIRMRRSSTFQATLKEWGNRYGSSAVQPLLEIAGNKTKPDPDRYVALMGAAKLGGKTIAPKLTPFLKDHSWMMRNASLRALSALHHPQTASAILPLVKDPALVVRLEAVTAIEKLNPPGATEALLTAIQSRDNYHGGKAQWVPQKALSALVKLRAKAVAPQLRPLLDHQLDPDLQRKTIETLESLTGRVVDHSLPLSEQIRLWKAALRSG